MVRAARGSSLPSTDVHTLVASAFSDTSSGLGMCYAKLKSALDSPHKNTLLALVRSGTDLAGTADDIVHSSYTQVDGTSFDITTSSVCARFLSEHYTL